MRNYDDRFFLCKDTLLVWQDLDKIISSELLSYKGSLYWIRETKLEPKERLKSFHIKLVLFITANHATLLELH